MSALGQKRTSELVQSMSAITPKADIEGVLTNVRFVPKADSCTAAKRALFDHLVGGDKQSRRYREAESLRSLEIDH
jgi:hypothetical protein